MCARARQETVVSLALQCLQTGNVCPGKREEILPPHIANTGRVETHADTETHTHGHTRLQKEEFDGSSSLCERGGVFGIGEVGVTGLGTNCSSLPSTLTANANSSR